MVTYEATGNKETVCPEGGIFVNTGDKRALMEAAKRIVEKGKVSLSTYCTDWVCCNFDKQINYDKYIRLYREIEESS